MNTLPIENYYVQQSVLITNVIYIHTAALHNVFYNTIRIVGNYTNIEDRAVNIVFNEDSQYLINLLLNCHVHWLQSILKRHTFSNYIGSFSD